MKTILTNILFFILFPILGGCHVEGSKQSTKTMQNNLEFKCWVYPSGSESEAYLIKLLSSGVLCVEKGVKSNKEDIYKKVEVSESKKLDAIDLRSLKSALNEVSSLKEIERGPLRKGGWEIELYHEGKLYHFYYGTQKDNPLGNMIEIIRKISPLEIDIHSWS